MPLMVDACQASMPPATHEPSAFHRLRARRQPRCGPGGAARCAQSFPQTCLGWPRSCPPAWQGAAATGLDGACFGVGNCGAILANDLGSGQMIWDQGWGADDQIGDQGWWVDDQRVSALHHSCCKCAGHVDKRWRPGRACSCTAARRGLRGHLTAWHFPRCLSECTFHMA